MMLIANNIKTKYIFARKISSFPTFSEIMKSVLFLRLLSIELLRL